MSSLRHAILGLLARHPATGYGIAKSMDRPVGYFWHARHSQIYPELEAMTTDGLVLPTTIEGRGPRPTKEYRLTDAGRQVLMEWLESPLNELPAGRDEFPLRVWSAWLLPPERVAGLVQERRDLAAERLGEYQRKLDALPDDLAPNDPLFSEWMALTAGVGYEAYRLAWCEQVLARLSSP